MLPQTRKPPTRPARPNPRKIPDALIYEVMDGEPIYYKGYRAVLSGKKTIGEIMGASSLQWIIVSYVHRIMVRFLDETRYWFAVGEAGVHIDHRNNLSHDVAIYDREVLTPAKINKKYADVPALVAVEIDIQADLSKDRDWQYVTRKTRKLLNFGTRKVIWIFTDSRQVLVAERGAEAWLTMDWDRDIDLLDGQRFNIGGYLASEGIQVEEL